MCGIAGAFRFDGPADTAHVEAMAASMEHRGPDSKRTVALADGVLCARRLAIVDVEGGENPLPDSDERVWIAHNGEVYNHGPLRNELQGRGAVFATATDTEVAAHLWADLPRDSLSRLQGMFALAIYDVERRSLTLVRDRLGQKPLYYTWAPDGTLLFASELKGLLSHPGVSRNLRPEALDELLLFEYVPAPGTLYEGIHKLEAGTCLEANASGWHIKRWWEPPIPGAELDEFSPGHASERIRASLQIAVFSRMVAEVPVAYLLSGGIDSTSVTALAARRRGETLDTFSVVFNEPSFDESKPAALAARLLGCRHTEIPFVAADLAGVLESLEGSLCEPLLDGSLPATWWLSRAVREAGFKVALSGDGADEHFGGYPTYAAHRIAGPVSRSHRLISSLAEKLPASTDNLSPAYLAQRFGQGLAHPLPRRNQVWLGAFLPEELSALTGRPPQPWSVVDRWGEKVRDASPVAQAMYLDQRLYLAEGVLQKVDRASMAHGLEVRSPFCHHELVELAARMPPRAHTRGRGTKTLLRRAVADLLPKELVERPKKGFGTPLGPWLAGPCTGLLDDLPERLSGFLEGAPVRALISAHRDGEQDHRRRLWSLLVLSRWIHGPWGPG